MSFRRKLSRRASRAIFKKHARVRSENKTKTMRGGYRL